MTLNCRLARDRKRTQGLRVFLDGVEKTRSAFYVDGRRGVVREYVRDAQGHVVLDKGGAPGTYWCEIRTRELRGRVSWKRRTEA